MDGPEVAIEQLFIENIEISMRLVNADTTPLLSKTVRVGKLISRSFWLDRILDASELSGDAGDPERR
ncbi:hypothetical protein CNY89_26900, partial [Amaricoccus sp. HAR-UPW-R2A-40]